MLSKSVQGSEFSKENPPSHAHGYASEVNMQRAARRSHSETVLKMLSCPLLPKLSLTHLSDSDPLQTCAVP